MKEAWEAGPRSAAELKEAATHFERAAELEAAPAVKAGLLQNAAGGLGGTVAFTTSVMAQKEKAARQNHLPPRPLRAPPS